MQMGHAVDLGCGSVGSRAFRCVLGRRSLWRARGRCGGIAMRIASLDTRRTREPPDTFLIDEKGMAPMTENTAALRSILVERFLPLPRESVWTALTRSDLIGSWLMENDFEPRVGRRFNFRATPMYGWNGVADCEVLLVEPGTRLAYSWNASGEQAADGLATTVTWRLTPDGGGTRVRMEQSGFRPQDEGGYQSMSSGWPRMLQGLERVAGGI
jgi:uncharacterized protein YndB with AHSA1/START domain